MLDNKIEQYSKNKEAVSVSRLKGLYNPKWIKWRLDNPDIEDDDVRHFRVGKAIDTILTEPGTFFEQYAVSGKRPSGLMGIFIDNLPLDLDRKSAEDEYEQAYNIAGYKMPLTTVITKLWQTSEYEEYYQTRKRAVGKTILGAEEYLDVLHCRDYLMNNPYTRVYFQPTNPRHQVIFQVPIYWMLEGVQCKGLLDGVLIDHEKKVIKPFDLKTMSRAVTSFPQSFMKYGYYLQGSYYWSGLVSIIKGNSDTRKKFCEEYNLDESIKDYTIDYMRWIVVESRSTQSNPARIFTTSEAEYYMGMNGKQIRGKSYPGVIELLRTWQWHKEKDYWDLPKELVDNNGEIPLNILD